MFPTPDQLGLPAKFQHWRRNQVRAINDGLECDKRFIVQSQKTGEGKSLTHIAQALVATNKRFEYLTPIKGLQDQLRADFESVGLVDIRGKSSYRCEGMPGHSCAEGSVAKCPYKNTSVCEYNTAKYAASTGRIVVANYACHIAGYKYGKGFGKFDVMICDEAHSISSEVEKAVQVLISEREIYEDLGAKWPEDKSSMDSWKHWAKLRRTAADVILQGLKKDMEKSTKRESISLSKRLTHYTNLVRRLAEIATCNPAKWVCDEWTGGYRFDPIDAGDYTEKILFRGTEKVIFSSNTVSYHSLEQMGVDTSDCAFFDYPSLNGARSPIIYIPTTKVNMYSQSWELRKLVRRIDEIFSSRMDRKGIIHTSSYKIRDFIMQHSEYAKFFVSNYKHFGDITSYTIEQFKRMNAPALLVSPSVTTGYDFPYDMCRYQIIAKLNFPYAGSKVEKARMTIDKDRSSAHAIVALQQAVGRGDRSEDDFQEVFILDDAFPTLVWKHNDMFRPSFLACMETRNNVPSAPMMVA